MDYLVVTAAEGEDVPKNKRAKVFYLHAYASVNGIWSGPKKWTVDPCFADLFISETTAHHTAKRKGAKFYKVGPKTV